MMTIAAVVNARTYDWETWLVGIMRSFVSGGAAAIVASVATFGLDPAHFNLVTVEGFGHTLLLMLIMFILQGIVHLAIFLQTHPSPEVVAQQAAEKAAEEIMAKAQSAGAGSSTGTLPVGPGSTGNGQ